MRATCRLIVDFVSGNVAPPARDIAMHRNLIQYRPLKLQPQEDMLVEICRLAALLFSLCVMFPWPDWSHKRILASMLELKMSESGLLQGVGFAGTQSAEERNWEKRKTELEFLFWAAMIGAMTMTHEASSFVSLLARIANGLEVKEWHEVQGILARYSWLDEAYDEGGQTVCMGVLEEREGHGCVGGGSMDLEGGNEGRDFDYGFDDWLSGG